MFTAIDPVFGTHLKIEIFARVYLNLYNCIIGTFIAIIIDRSLSLTEDYFWAANFLAYSFRSVYKFFFFYHI